MFCSCLYRLHVLSLSPYKTGSSIKSCVFTFTVPVHIDHDTFACKLRQLLYTVKYCEEGNNTSGIDLNLNMDDYQRHIHSYRQIFGNNAEWEQWMIDNKSRYITAFNIARKKPSLIKVSFQYEKTPIAYNPPWSSEAEHMQALKDLAMGTYPGYKFDFIFNGDTNTSCCNVIAGIATNLPNNTGKYLYLYYETIFGHEFAHLMGIPHHYDDNDNLSGNGLHMSQGETKALWIRVQNNFVLPVGLHYIYH